MTLLQRIALEKRGLLLPLAIALLLNIAVYALVVYPLGVKAASVADRAAAASQARRLAESDMASAEALVTGKAKADQELATFYQKVMQASLDEARRMTYARLPALAKKADMRSPSATRISTCSSRKRRSSDACARGWCSKAATKASGSFLRAETTPEFIIVDDVSLGQPEPNKPVTLTLEVSTYYGQGRDGSLSADARWRSRASSLHC